MIKFYVPTREKWRKIGEKVEKIKDESIENKKVCIDVNKSMSYEITKRTIDIIGSLCGVILLLPVLIVVAVLIKIENPKGSIIFTQNRCGKNGKIFKMYKFRSMVYNAEELLEKLKEKNEQTGPVFKISNDPRITKIGKFIRRTSLDELPQLINILKGDMSIVGPRPAIITEVELYNEYQMQRLLVKPGLTCIWQVSGRNSIGFDEWVELDLRYIKERTLLLDIKLIFKTIRVLFGDNNAS